MPPSDTQQSEAMPADTPPKPASSEASAPSAPLSDVDDLLEQVQSLTQDIIEDATAEADAIDDDESVGGQSTVENDDTTQVEAETATDEDGATGDEGAVEEDVCAEETDEVAADVADANDVEDASAEVGSLESAAEPSSVLPPVLELDTDDEALDSVETDAVVDVEAIGDLENDTDAGAMVGDVDEHEEEAEVAAVGDEASAIEDDAAVETNGGDEFVASSEPDTTSEADDDEALAILDSLQSESQAPDSVLEIDPEGLLAEPSVGASELDYDDAAIEQGGEDDAAAMATTDVEDQSNESLTATDTAEGEVDANASNDEVTATDDTGDVAELSADDEADLPDLLQDPDSDEATEAQAVLNAAGIDDVESEESAEHEAREPVDATSAKTYEKGARRKKTRWLRVAQHGLQKVVYRVRYTVTHPAQLVQAILAGPRYVFASFDRGLAWLDRPFAEMSLQKKQMIGIVALATLLAGVLIWVLPMIAFTNPFDGMSRGISSGP